jgi:hypothetical protein
LPQDESITAANLTTKRTPPANPGGKPTPPIMNENSATNGPRVITHHLEGYTITEEHHEITDGSLKCDCTITDAQGEFVRRYAKLEDARGYVRAHVDMERIKAEVRQSQGQQPKRSMRIASRPMVTTS